MKIKIVALILFIHLVGFSLAQNKQQETCFLFYNTENLFDLVDDPDTADDEFTPEGVRHWTQERLMTKLNHISKVVQSSCAWESAAVIGLCEIENRAVLDDLLRHTALAKRKYKIIHKESPDHRGIDVAMLYDEKKFYPVYYEHIPLFGKRGNVQSTREILYVKGLIRNRDTLHVFMNHWPSRYGGVLESQPARIAAAGRLKARVDKLFETSKDPAILIMGDFNDQPTDQSIRQVLGAEINLNDPKTDRLYNLSGAWLNGKRGTLKYRSQWYVYDQIIVSGALLQASGAMYTSQDHARIAIAPMLLEDDERYGGKKPRRTFYGFQYRGGFSDHFPVRLSLLSTP